MIANSLVNYSWMLNDSTAITIIATVVVVIVATTIGCESHSVVAASQ